MKTDADHAESGRPYEAPKKAPPRPTRRRDKVGRKPKLTKEIETKLVCLLKAGHVISVACAAVGIGERTFHRWMAQGWLETEGTYWQFRQLVLRARAECEVALLHTIYKHAKNDWRAAAWLLERLFPARYSTRLVNALCEGLREAQASPRLPIFNLPKVFDTPCTPQSPAGENDHTPPGRVEP